MRFFGNSVFERTVFSVHPLVTSRSTPDSGEERDNSVHPTQASLNPKCPWFDKSVQQSGARTSCPPYCGQDARASFHLVARSKPQATPGATVIAFSQSPHPPPFPGTFCPRRKSLNHNDLRKSIFRMPSIFTTRGRQIECFENYFLELFCVL
jgi:hypothetical protein